jgi:hypothetical protein
MMAEQIAKELVISAPPLLEFQADPAKRAAQAKRTEEFAEAHKKFILETVNKNVLKITKQLVPLKAILQYTSGTSLIFMVLVPH